MKPAVQTGELSARSYLDYQKTCKRIAKSIGKQPVVSEIDVSDLEKLRASLCEGNRLLIAGFSDSLPRSAFGVRGW
jgi:hypothetical protein